MSYFGSIATIVGRLIREFRFSSNSEQVSAPYREGSSRSISSLPRLVVLANALLDPPSSGDVWLSANPTTEITGIGYKDAEFGKLWAHLLLM